jgi:hypothetical protein
MVGLLLILIPYHIHRTDPTEFIILKEIISLTQKDMRINAVAI